jgi:hypothetical protein
VQVVGIDIWNGSATQVQVFAQGGGRNVTYPLGMQGGTYGGLWGLDRHSLVIVDAQGIIQYITPQSTPYTQRLTRHEAEILAKLDELTQMTGVQDGPSSVVASFRLRQNRPNPFIVTTSLQFDLGPNPPEQITRLTVFDLLGREVRTIVNRHLTAGTHTVQWDGKDNQGRQVPPGIYFCELAAGRQRSMKRMVFLPH